MRLTSFSARIVSMTDWTICMSKRMMLTNVEPHLPPLDLFEAAGYAIKTLNLEAIQIQITGTVSMEHDVSYDS